MPYIGGEGESDIRWDNWVYGLATRDGVVVTDPVFLEAALRSWYDANTFQSVSLPVYQLTTAAQDADGVPYTHFGLAGEDGSWYTGLVYSGLVCVSEYGALVLTLEGDMVMVAPDGQERFRWPAGQIPLPDFHPTPWITREVRGPWMCYVAGWNDDGSPDNLYVDLRTGQVQAQTPADYPPDPVIESNVGYFPGGQFVLAGEDITIRMDTGGTYTFSVPVSSNYPIFNGELILFNRSAGRVTVTNLNGEVQFTRTDGPLSLVTQMNQQSPALFARYPDTGDSLTVEQIVLDREGRDLLRCQGYALQYGDRILYASEAYYHLCDLEGNDLLRIPRLSG